MGIRRLLTSLRALVAMPDRLSRDLRHLKSDLGSTIAEANQRTAETSERTARKHQVDISALRSELAALRAEVGDRLLQNQLQLGRLATLVNSGEEVLPLGRRVPTAVARVRAPQGVSTASDLAAGTSNEWLELSACPACGTAERTVVCEWNKLVLLETAPDEHAMRYDYAICHGCGILYATRRPFGRRYGYLLEHFEDVIDKNGKNPLLNPHPLTDKDRDRYRQLIARGVFVSDHEDGDYLSGVFKDRFANAGHVDILGSLLTPRGARVLEVRPRAGTILEGLRRHYGADVYAMPIWESQQFILRELYGIQTSELIDFDDFAIPFDEPFDLIVCNHMFNHAVRLDRFLAEVRGALKPGGHLYLYNEIDDGEFLQSGQSMIATMNPLHLQACDRPSLVRAVASSGFEPVFVKGRDRRNFCLMRRVDAPDWTPVPQADLGKRIDLYRRARDRAVLRAPEGLRARFADVWPVTVERAVASGVARFDDEGQLRIVKQYE
ncbi:MAG: class I SAM-dependent methyltransferase [Acidobacteria bacterium]|nr:class I SAM-dependent methyltransferase [Acidobacteriota bacterium]